MPLPPAAQPGRWFPRTRGLQSCSRCPTPPKNGDRVVDLDPSGLAAALPGLVHAKAGALKAAGKHIPPCGPSH